MPKIYHECDRSVTDIATVLLAKFYRELTVADLRICYLFVENPDAVGSALTHAGYPAAATVKANSLKDRVEGKADVTITIDKAWWDGHDELQCTALLDQMLYQVLIAIGDDGKVETDDISRPKVRIRPADWRIAGFYDVAKRHGDNSVEAMTTKEVYDKLISA